MDENFRKEFREIQNQARLGVNAYYFSHMEKLTDSYREAMAGACRQVKAMQDKGYQDVEFMEITMLRTRLLEQDFQAPILVYGPNGTRILVRPRQGRLTQGESFRFMRIWRRRRSAL